MVSFHRVWLLAMSLLCAIAAAAQQSPAPSETAPPTFAALRQMAALPETEIDIAEGALQVAKGVNPSVDIDRYLAKLDALAGEMKQRIGPRTDPEAQLRVMGAVMYHDWGFGRSDVVAPDVYVGFNEVLDQQQWNCFGLAILYVNLGERLGIPLRMVAGAGHVFVEYEGAMPLYVETTDKGRIHDSKDYVSTYLPFPCVNPGDYTVLDKKETVAVVLTQTALAVQNRGNLDLARQYYELALAFRPQDAEAYSGLGFLALNAGRTKEAIDAFRRAIEANPRYREAHGGLGAALYSAGDLAGAAAAYRKALDLCPDEPKAVFNLAQVLYEQDHLQESAGLFRTYTQLVPNDPDGYARLAFPLEDLGDLDGALAAYRKAIQLNPQYVDAYINMGIVYEKKKELSAARQAFETAIRMQSGNALAYAGLARVYHAQGNNQQALAAITRAAQLDPANAAVWLDFGAILRGTGDTDRAIEAYQRAALLLPGDPEAFEALSEIHLQKGDLEAARAAAQRASALGAELPPEVRDLLESTVQE